MRRARRVCQQTPVRRPPVLIRLRFLVEAEGALDRLELRNRRRPGDTYGRRLDSLRVCSSVLGRQCSPVLSRSCTRIVSICQTCCPGRVSQIDPTAVRLLEAIVTR